jgi:DNA invertase Pin-like site-specific DNA recombinase
MRVALYLRVSTNDKGQNPENQLRQLRDYYQAQKWDLTKEYVDYDSGSKKRDGQQFIGMLEDARQRKFDTLLFWSLDRFSREGALNTLIYLRDFSSWGVDFCSFTEQYLNTTGVWKNALIGILATIAQQESIRISERVRAGMARAKANGSIIGRKSVTKMHKRNGVTIAPVDPEKVKDMRMQGMTCRAIALKLKVSPATVMRLGGKGVSKGVQKPPADLMQLKALPLLASAFQNDLVFEQETTQG